MAYPCWVWGVSQFSAPAGWALGRPYIFTLQPLEMPILQSVQQLKISAAMIPESMWRCQVMTVSHDKNDTFFGFTEICYINY